MVGISGMVAQEAIADVILLEHLESAVSKDIVINPLPIAEVKGWFKKVGKFFTKVLKTVAVVATYAIVAAVTVYNVAVAADESGYKSGSAALKAIFGAGAMIELASTWKRSWKWVGWNDWSRW